jgi:hypothetical protein
MFGLITRLVWVNSWFVELMVSRKKFSGNRLDLGWKHGIDIDKNSRKIQCKKQRESTDYLFQVC